MLFVTFAKNFISLLMVIAALHAQLILLIVLIVNNQMDMISTVHHAFLDFTLIPQPLVQHANHLQKIAKHVKDYFQLQQPFA
jgi:hypothetical protein